MVLGHTQNPELKRHWPILYLWYNEETRAGGESCLDHSKVGSNGRWGDNLTCKQDSSTTFGKSREAQEFGLSSLAPANDGHPDCLLSWEMAVQIEISRMSSMSFVYMSSCHPIALFLLIHRILKTTNFAHAAMKRTPNPSNVNALLKPGTTFC